MGIYGKERSTFGNKNLPQFNKFENGIDKMLHTFQVDSLSGHVWDQKETMYSFIFQKELINNCDQYQRETAG